jgi:hypothetical protein
MGRDAPPRSSNGVSEKWLEVLESLPRANDCSAEKTNAVKG